MRMAISISWGRSAVLLCRFSFSCFLCEAFSSASVGAMWRGSIMYSKGSRYHVSVCVALCHFHFACVVMHAEMKRVPNAGIKNVLS
jgi:hypothetical protein